MDAISEKINCRLMDPVSSTEYACQPRNCIDVTDTTEGYGTHRTNASISTNVSRAEGALSSVAVRSGARIFECPVHTYIHYLLCRLGEWLGLVHALWRSRIETLAARASPGPDSVAVIRGPELLWG